MQDVSVEPFVLLQCKRSWSEGHRDHADTILQLPIPTPAAEAGTPSDGVLNRTHVPTLTMHELARHQGLVLRLRGSTITLLSLTTASFTTCWRPLGRMAELDQGT